ncbi:Acetyltransferase [Labilithrix luteola]|uniref:Acetyltransferase n=1 Tax=Labilithrix luteola TaxID=1391654 RepID=A0A0K1Q3C6_9BACT|nr:Acetyltransferase [Labilithrix luteola]
MGGDEAAAERFLGTRAETTMILRSNLARAGLVNEGRSFQGTYVGAFVGDELEGLATLAWTGNLLLAGGPHVVALTEMLAAHAPAGFRGILGTASEVAEARRVIDARFGSAVRKHHHEILYSLSLADLVVPEALSRLAARAPNEDDMALVLDWRMQYSAELSDLPDTPEERRRQRDVLEAFHADGHAVLLCDGMTPVAYSGFNATLPDMVQIGGVFTPPALRGRGYARCAVAASLVAARSRGVERAILFTGNGNTAAQRSYLALGFRPIGDYALVIFE